MELRLLIEMKNIQEERLEKEAKRIAKMQKSQQSNNPDSAYQVAPHLQDLPW